MPNEQIQSLTEALAQLDRVSGWLLNGDSALSSKRQGSGQPSEADHARAYSADALDGLQPQSWPVLLRMWRNTLIDWWLSLHQAEAAFFAARPILVELTDNPTEPAVDRWSSRLYRHLSSIRNGVPHENDSYGTLPVGWNQEAESLNGYILVLDSLPMNEGQQSSDAAIVLEAKAGPLETKKCSGGPPPRPSKAVQ